jgi:hypothetical protein
MTMRAPCCAGADPTSEYAPSEVENRANRSWFAPEQSILDHLLQRHVQGDAALSFKLAHTGRTSQ